MLTFLPALLLAPLALAVRLPPRPLPPKLPPSLKAEVQNVHTGDTLPPITTVYTFQQLIDHDNPSLGTFTQRYWTTWEFYKAGGPIVMFTPGEDAADPYVGYLTNATINGQIAQQQHGATIVIEHRYYGLSNPFSDLSVASLKYHTIQQAVDDLVYFAENVVLPMPGGDQVAPSKAPWVLVGGSYSGALTAFIKVNKPDTFFVGYASSAVVESIVDFWGYFEPIRLFMPKNCSADVQAAIAHIDQVFASGNTAAISAIKNSFGMGDVVHPDDVTGSLRENLWDWQSLQPASGPGATFFQFCDALEVKNGVSAPASGWGAEHAVAAWGDFWTTGGYLNLICGGDDAEDCLGSYNTSQSFWTDTSLNNADRSWMWIVCTEVGFFQDAAPAGYPSLVSRLAQISGDERQCVQMFPAAFKTPPTPNVGKTNAAYEGWNLKAERLFIANGQSDPWRYATTSSGFVNIASTPEQPIAEGNGFHCSDLLTENGGVDSTVLAVQNQGLAVIGKWLAEWKPGSTH
ncbi:peptidase S28 [Artomyces pyxidatus]|uniref:Peptidase S28 n=1 Tax=Artomyces pyxidatus TaxID=48021 RepID=A0ACB8TB16_9AGAM|nr:peptidase S28 [Artomyces pyxidatus]